MKFVKGISLFFVLPVLLVVIGFIMGNHFFQNENHITEEQVSDLNKNDNKKVQFRATSVG